MTKFFTTIFKAFADNIMNVSQMMISDFDTVAKIVDKGENDGYQLFFLSPTIFSNALKTDFEI